MSKIRIGIDIWSNMPGVGRPFEKAFRFTIDTNNTSIGSTSADQFRLPLFGAGTYDFHVDWGDGTFDDITVFNASAVTHTYAVAGVYNVVITGTLIGWRFNNTGDRNKLLNISEWGVLNPGPLPNNFDGCENMTTTAQDVLNTSTMTSTRFMFGYCALFNGPLNDCDMSNVTDMSSMFEGCSSFNQPINNWNTSNVTDTNNMFYLADSFNQPLDNWNVDSVTDMHGMFDSAADFDQDISGWNVSNVTLMYFMFYDCVSFNQDIGGWNVSSCVDMTEMFIGATSFDQDIGGWNVSVVEFMDGMFDGVTLSTVNYNSLLIGWNSLPSLVSLVNFSGGNSRYSAGAAATARANIISTYSWTITDGGPA